MNNPILETSALPLFSRMNPADVLPAIEQLLTEARAELAQVLAAGEASWAGLAQPLEDIGERVARVWSPVSHLHSVMDSEPLREAYNACLPLLSDYTTELGQNQALCAAFKRLASDQAGLDSAQRKIISNTLRDFRLSGIDLPEAERQRYKQIMQRLSQLTSQFGQHLLDATNAWQLHITDAARLAGLPDSARGLMRQTAEQAGLEGWLLRLEFPYYLPVMTYADDRALREEMYTAYVTRASDQGPHAGQWDNGPVMAEILALRHELARLLGFANYAEYSLATKMAADPEQVLGFLGDLAQRTLPMARQELEALRGFAREQFGVESIEAWDVSYYGEKLRLHRYAISQEELRPYFPVDRVLSGMFQVVNRLYGLTIQAREDVELWHPTVRFFDILAANGELRGRFYLDLYARPHKRGGAWMDDCRARHRRADGTLQTPVAYLVCNFTPPVGDDPALLSHDEVQTLFHEFGHGLHHMLTRIDYAGVSGISGVPWDAVELPSQFLENWCWQREALDLMAAHYQTGAALPEALFERMIAAKNFQSGMQMMRQLEFALFDFRLHKQYDPHQGAQVYEVLAQVREEVAVIRPPSFNRFPHSFSHIFAGGYAAGYYSYKWAEVLSADAFSLFEENGIFDPETGQRFLCTILEQGGSREPMELFVEFRGREPAIDALLRHSGITAGETRA